MKGGVERWKRFCEERGITVKVLRLVETHSVGETCLNGWFGDDISETLRVKSLLSPRIAMGRHELRRAKVMSSIEAKASGQELADRVSSHHRLLGVFYYSGNGYDTDDGKHRLKNAVVETTGTSSTTTRRA